MADENDESMFIVLCVLHDLVSDFQSNSTHLGIHHVDCELQQSLTGGQVDEPLECIFVEDEDIDAVI